MAARRVQWKFDDYLERHGLTAARVEREIIKQGYPWGAKTIYRFTGEGPKNINRHSLEAILAGLEQLTGQPVTVSDLLGITRDAPCEPQKKQESWRDLVGVLGDTGDPKDMSVNHDAYIDEALWDEHQESVRGER